jgi:multidrug efflux pump subunit AcrB
MKYMPVTVDIVLIISIFVSLIFLPVVLTSLNFKVKKESKKTKNNDKKEEENKLF